MNNNQDNETPSSVTETLICEEDANFFTFLFRFIYFVVCDCKFFVSIKDFSNRYF